MEVKPTNETRSRNKRSDADEDRDLFDRHGRTRDLGLTSSIQEKLNQARHASRMHSQRFGSMNSEFRIKWPQG